MAATATEQGRLGSTVAGRYRLLRVLGRGGMGIVYEAENISTRRRVAIKIMHPENQLNQENVKRFLNEGANAGRVKHPNIVEFIEMGQDPADGSLFIVLELLRGTDLSTYLVKYGRMEPRDAIVVTAQVLQALSVAHAAEIVHRDVKPENIFLTKGSAGDAHVKIVDFGISKAINPEKAFMGSITQINTTVGTPHYMSPEQAKGEPIDPRADLWALGVVLYESLTGHLPFDGDNFNTQIVAVVTEAHLPASTYGVDRPLSDIIDRCLQKDRNQRFANASEMLTALREYVLRYPAVGLAESSLFDDPAVGPVSPSKPAPPRPVEVVTMRDNEPLESTAAVFPGMVRIEDEATASSDAAPTAVRPLDRSVVRPTTHAPSAPPAPVDDAPVASPDEPRGPSPLLLVAVAFVTALITGSTTYMVYQATRPAAQASNMVRVQFLGLSAGATVFIDGVRCERPDGVQLPRRNTDVHVRVVAEGFRPLEFRLRPERDQAVSLPPLVPAPPALHPLTLDAGPAPQPAALVPAPLAAPTAPRPPTVAPQTAPAAPRPPAARPAPPVAAAPASLTVGGAGCVVYVDGQRVGPAPLVRFPVTAGAHDVDCERNGQRARNRATVTAGQTTLVRF